MKLTKSQLREIIREEISKLNESKSNLDKAIALLPSNISKQMDVSGGFGGPTIYELGSKSSDYILAIYGDANAERGSIGVGIQDDNEGTVIGGREFKNATQAASHFMNLYKKEWKKYEKL